MAGMPIFLLIVFRQADSTLLSRFVKLPDISSNKSNDLEGGCQDEGDLGETVSLTFLHQ